jgi:ABC-type glycerol-3-phosphate transport system permease component
VSYVARSVKYVTLVLASIVTILPIIVIVMASFKTHKEFYASSPLSPPSSWLNVDNYVTAFTKGLMLQGFANTAFILLFSIAGTIFIGSMAAYAIDRFEFRFKKTTVALFLLATLVPGVTTQVATFQVVHSLGLYNTRWAAIALFMGTDIVSIYIFIQFMRGIPKELDEAATLDGANHFTIYRRIILPLLIKGIGVYNEFYTPFLYMPARNLGVISTSLFRFRGPFSSQWEVIAAGVIIVIIPTLVIFLFLQRYIYNGFTSGATK